jgi:hypothetical protein
MFRRGDYWMDRSFRRLRRESDRFFSLSSKIETDASSSNPIEEV